MKSEDESADVKLLENSIEFLKRDLEMSKDALSKLPDLKRLAEEEPAAFLHKLKSHLKMKGFCQSKSIPPISKAKYVPVLTDLGRSFEEAFPSRLQYRQKRQKQKRPLANKRLNLNDIRAKLAAYMPRNKLTIKVPNGYGPDLIHCESPPCSPAMSAYSPYASPINVHSTLSLPGSSLRMPSAKPVHFTKTRVSGGFYLAQAGLSSPYMVSLEDKTIKKQKEKRNSVTSQLDQMSTIPLAQKMTREYNDLMKLLREKHSRQIISSGVSYSTAIHSGYQCDSCHREPITGIRWNCIDCPLDNAVDLCDDCYWKRHTVHTESTTHLETHRFRDILVADAYWDEDDGIYNYLNPGLEEE